MPDGPTRLGAPIPPPAPVTISKDRFDELTAMEVRLDRIATSQQFVSLLLRHGIMSDQLQKRLAGAEAAWEEIWK